MQTLRVLNPRVICTFLKSHKQASLLLLIGATLLFCFSLSHADAAGVAGSMALPPPPPPPTPTPYVSVDLPDEVLIGQDFDFQVKFRNAGGAAGFGPYVELYFPSKGPDGNTLSLKCDGISFKSAVTLFTNPPAVPLLSTYDSSLDTAATPFPAFPPGSAWG